MQISIAHDNRAKIAFNQSRVQCITIGDQRTKHSIWPHMASSLELTLSSLMKLDRNGSKTQDCLLQPSPTSGASRDIPHAASSRVFMYACICLARKLAFCACAWSAHCSDPASSWYAPNHYIERNLVADGLPWLQVDIECPKEATCVTDTTTLPNADNAIIVPDDGLFYSNPFSVQLYECAIDSCTYDGRHERIDEYQIAISRDPSLQRDIGLARKSSNQNLQVPFQTRQEIQLEAGFIVLSATRKVLVTYLQTLFMISWIGRSNNILPTELFAIMDTLQAFFANTYNWHPLECALQGSYGVDKRILVMIITIFFPWMGSRSIKSFSWTNYGSRMILSLIIVIFFYYPTWVQAFLEIFLCYTVNTDDEGSDTKRAIKAGLHTGARWVSNFNLQCYEGEHAVLAFTVGIAELIFIVVTPIHLAWRLWYAWESYVMLRKLVFAPTLMYLSSPFAPVGSQTLTALAIAGIALAAQVILRPHTSNYVHNMEILAHTAIIISLFLCTYLVSTDQLPAGYIVIQILLSSVNIITIAIFVISMLNQLFDTMLLVAGLDAEEVLEMPKHTLINLMLPVYRAKYKFLGKPLAVFFFTLSRLQWKAGVAAHWARQAVFGEPGNPVANRALQAKIPTMIQYSSQTIKYPAVGSPEVAAKVKALLQRAGIACEEDSKRG
eukprot:gene29036-32237_t